MITAHLRLPKGWRLVIEDKEGKNRIEVVPEANWDRLFSIAEIQLAS